MEGAQQSKKRVCRLAEAPLNVQLSHNELTHVGKHTNGGKEIVLRAIRGPGTVCIPTSKTGKLIHGHQIEFSKGIASVLEQNYIRL